MKEAAEFAICYDISDNRERARVEKILKGFGFRAQKSVFECRLTRGTKATLVQMLSGLNVQTGSIKFYRIYAGADKLIIGQPAESKDDHFAYSL